MKTTKTGLLATTDRRQPWAGLPAQGPIMRPRAAAGYFGVSISTYYELIQAGIVPPFIKLSHRARAAGVPKAWLDAAIAARAAQS
jgi:predicted DNA-binding transcriptional regulator AlpA